MAKSKYDWVKLQAEFLAAHEKTGVTVQLWCEQQDIKYASARRYIKTSKVKAIVKTKLKAKAKAPAKVPPPKQIGNFKHGGYSHYFNTDITSLVDGTDLTDELDLCRARIHLVVCTIEEIQRRLSDKDDPVNTETAASLYTSLFKADEALDKNIARVESITKTLSSIDIDEVNQIKIVADTNRIVETTKATVINAKKSIVQTELAQLTVEKARKEAGGTSKLDDYIDKMTGGSVDTVIG
jgi:hypothetical protein